MAGAFDCSICENAYDETGRKPLVLLCGHTYCQQCLQNMVSGSSPACPSCRKEIVTPVNELPVNFIAIPSISGEVTSGSVANAEMFCNSHQNELDYWCTQCKVLICKQGLVQTHAEHKFILAKEIFADERILPHLKGQINANLLKVKAFIHNLQQLQSFAGVTDEVKSTIPQLKEALLKQESTLDNLLTLLEEISSELSLEQKNLVLKMLKDQNQMKLEEVSVHLALKPFQDQGVLCQICNIPNGRNDKLIEKYMPDGHPWIIISNELGEKALCTMKETDHQTPKAIVISTDESPILCLPELLQYLSVSSTTMELQLMDKAVKNIQQKDWLHLKAGEDESIDINHCYRLKTLAHSLVGFQTVTAAQTAADKIAQDSTKNKLLILVYPATRTYDVCVLADGKIVKNKTGAWPLPLEIHVIGMNRLNLEWVKSILSSLYYLAQPNLGECRVYLPQYYDHGVDQQVVQFYNNISQVRHISHLFPVFAELGRKFSTKHRLYLHTIYNDQNYLEAAEAQKIALEFRNF